MGPSSDLTYLLQHLAAVLTKQNDQILNEQLGIGYSQYRILMVLKINPRAQQNVIANHLGQTEASISRQVKVLKQKNLLTSKIDPKNRRRHLSVPTLLGQQITEAATNILSHDFKREYASFGDNELKALTQELERFHQLVCQPGKTGSCDHELKA